MAILDNFLKFWDATRGIFHEKFQLIEVRLWSYYKVSVFCFRAGKLFAGCPQLWPTKSSSAAAFAAGWLLAKAKAKAATWATTIVDWTRAELYLQPSLQFQSRVVASSVRFRET